MKKLKLNLEDLKVESFATTPEPRGERGTVFGQTLPTYGTDCPCDPTHYTQCTYPQQETCQATCGVTCTATTAENTDCPEQTQCQGYTMNYPTCTDVEQCTWCGEMC